MATTWSLAFQQVELRNPAAADLLRLCAWLAPDAIPEELFTEGADYLGTRLAPVAADPDRFNEAIAALRAWSLLDRDPQTHILTIHRLVQAVQQDALPPEDKLHWLTRTLGTLCAAFPWGVDHTIWSQCERLLPHAHALLPHLDAHPLPDGDDLPDLLLSIGVYLSARGLYAQAQPLLERSLTLQEQHLGSEHLTMALHQDELASLYWHQGMYQKAEPLLRQTLTTSEEQKGGEHPHVATSLNKLASLYQDQGCLHDAEPLFLRALAIREQQLGDRHPNTALSWWCLAALYEEQGTYDEVKPLYERSVAVFEQKFCNEQQDTKTVCANYAGLLREEEAREVERQGDDE